MDVLIKIVEGATYGLAILAAIAMTYIVVLTMVHNIRDYRYRFAWIELVVTLVLTAWMAYITFSKSDTISTIANSEYANNPEIKEALAFLSGIPYQVIVLFLAFWLIVDLVLRNKPEIARWFIPVKFLLTMLIVGNYVV